MLSASHTVLISEAGGLWLSKRSPAITIYTHYAKVKVSDLAKGDNVSEDGKRIDISTAWSVTTDNSAWKGYTKHVTEGADTTEITSGSTIYVKNGGFIYVEAVSKNVLLGEKDSPDELKNRLVDPSSVTSNATKGLWKYEVKKALGNDSFEPVITFGGATYGTTTAISTSLAAGAPSNRMALTGTAAGITLANKANVKFGTQDFKPVAGTPLAGVNLTAAYYKNAAGTGIELVVTPDKAVTLGASAVSNVGTLNMLVNGIPVAVVLQTSARNEAETLAAAKAAIEKALEGGLDAQDTAYANAAAVKGAIEAKLTGTGAIFAAGTGDYVALLDGGALNTKTSIAEVTAVMNGDKDHPKGITGVYDMTFNLTTGTGGNEVVTPVVVRVTAKAKTLKEVADKKIADAVTAITAYTTAIANANKAEPDAKNALEAAVNSTINGVSTDVKAAYSYAADAYTAPDDGVADGSLSVTITLTCEGGEAVSITKTLDIANS